MLAALKYSVRTFCSSFSIEVKVTVQPSFRLVTVRSKEREAA